MNTIPGTALLTVTLPGFDMPAIVTSVTEGLREPSASHPSNLRSTLTSVFGQKLAMIELPETIAVETRFITQHAAKQASITAVCDLQTPPCTKVEIEENTKEIEAIKIMPKADLPPNPPRISPKIYKDESVSAKPTITEVGTITNGPPPQRNRLVQTEEIVARTASIGIQCDMEWDLDFDLMTDPEIEIEKSENIKEQFQSFVKRRTQCYSNGKLECLICGEVDRNLESIERHMALHWGPKVLCWHCGIQFEHKSLLRHHHCNIETPQKRKRNELRCPHLRCGVSAISALELYDHLNEHAKLRPHKCSYCKKRFATAGELKQHSMLRLHCYCAKRKRYPYVPFKSPQERLYRMRVYIAYSQKTKCIIVKRKLLRNAKGMQCCQLCLWRCRDMRTFVRHRSKCLKRFLARGKRKNEVTPTSADGINGY